MLPLLKKKHNESEFHNTQVLREDAPSIVALRESEGKVMAFQEEEYASIFGLFQANCLFYVHQLPRKEAEQSRLHQLGSCLKAHNRLPRV